MARRRRSESPLGVALLATIGGVFWLADGVYQFFVKYPLPLLLAAAPFIFYLLLKLLRRSEDKQPSANQNATLIAEPFPPQITRSSGRPDARWITPTETVDVQGFKISAGLFYLGTGLPLSGQVSTQYVVNPRLALHRTETDLAGTTMAYWPSYETITPAARRSYVSWMSDGRKDPLAGIGHVFLFFYGLEHLVGS